jgi:hypothetical protein
MTDRNDGFGGPNWEKKPARTAAELRERLKNASEPEKPGEAVSESVVGASEADFAEPETAPEVETSTKSNFITATVDTTPVRTASMKPEVLPSVLRDRLEHEIASHERRYRSLPHGAPARRTCEGVIAVLRRCLEASDE